MLTALNTTEEVKRRRPRMAILPVGATEQHRCAGIVFATNRSHRIGNCCAISSFSGFLGSHILDVPRAHPPRKGNE